MRRAIKIAQEAGLHVAGIEVRRDSARVVIGENPDVDQVGEDADNPRPREWPKD